MSATNKVAIVTGSNKGIGYAIVKGLCEKYAGSVYLTSRNEARGKEAVNALKKLGYNPLFHQLDINDQASVDKFRDHVKNTHGGVDLLINNAAIAFSQDSKEKFSKQAEETVRTNYFGLLRVCEAFFPLLREHARVVNVSSSAGHLSRIPSEDLRNKFKDPQLTVAKLNDLMNEFINDRMQNIAAQKGWDESGYVVSKVGVCALTRIQQRDFENANLNKNVHVNSVHPGFVDTDMTNHEGILTIEEGAKSTLYLSLEPHDLKGQYIWDVKDNTNAQSSWGQNSYAVSKVGVSALTRVHQRIFDEEIPKRNIAINSVHPGYVATDMTKHRGVLTVEEGAKAPLYLAIGTHDLKGQYVWYDSTVVDWLAPNVPPRNY